jgi:hypothetical protein
MCLEASTKSNVHQKFEIFGTNITCTMAYLNFKNGLENGLCPLGLNIHYIHRKWLDLSLKSQTSWHLH